ncbi:MAG TPA: formylglycine-generating enzyme family protein [Hyphomicrobiaceae bacterium]|nr:formylglycine-generating enzyme family protein [Hyphomicrobiaceae bacterium]
MEIIQKLAIVDWLALAAVCAIIALAFGSESGFLAERKREAAAAMIGLAGLFAVMLVTSDAEDSVFFASLTEEQPKQRERKPKPDEDGPKTEPNQAHERDSSGPGDGDGGQGKEIKLTLAAGPGMNNGRGGLGGGGGPKKSGGQGGGGNQKNGQLQIEGNGSQAVAGGDGPNGSGANAGGSGGPQAQGGGNGAGNGPNAGNNPNGQGTGGKGGNGSGQDQKEDEFPTLKEAAGAAGGSLQDCPDCPRMVLIPAGAFDIGTDPESPGYRPEEGPKKRVQFRNPFYIGRFEVTRAEYSHFVQKTGHESSPGCVVDHQWQKQRSFEHPGYPQDPNHPVVCINWYDAQAYVQWLTKITGKVYRLPSEAEWEYAARGGKRTLYPSGETLTPGDANYAYRTRGTLPVGQFTPNLYGLADMAGNAWEMLADCWETGYEGLSEQGTARDREDCENRAIRGGAWYNGPRYLRVTSRWSNPAAAAGNGVGFRVVREFVVPASVAKNGRKMDAPTLKASDIQAAEQNVRRQVESGATAPAEQIQAERVPNQPAPRSDEQSSLASGVAPAGAVAAVAAAEAARKSAKAKSKSKKAEEKPKKVSDKKSSSGPKVR